MKIKIIILLFITIMHIFADKIHEYPVELVFEIKPGKENGKFGWDAEFNKHIGGIGPQSFFISKNNTIYACDNFNSRINVYDQNFNYLKEIKAGYGTSSSIKLYIDEKENIISFFHSTGLVKVNQIGELIFKINYLNLPTNVKGFHEFFIFNDDVVYFNEDENLIIIDNEGKRITDSNLLQVIVKYNKNHLKFDKEFLLQLKEGAEVELEKFIEKERLLIIDSIVYTMRYEKFKKYQDKIKELKKTITFNAFSDIFSILRESSLRIIGYDTDCNSYWEAQTKKEFIKNGGIQRVVVVYTKYGEIIDCFYDIGNYYPMAVAPSGDVYFRDSNPTDDKFHFYKVTRKWGLGQSEPIQIADTTSPKATTLTATSFIDYKKMYTPYSAFDNNPATAWLESADGPGTGESITISFNRPLTIDAVEFMPGLFDKKWWTANNRVKTLTIKLDDKPVIINFKDTMQPQKASFTGEKTFQKAEFIINAVYPSGKDNDTAISEITFYYKGEKLELDLEDVKP